ncbi:hypothetical protein BGZ83_002157 [Gryganskiella cystojenkinii]|nr:hypothetical protein BGZ83_002157 [Gryganskiella cystojenkinii]
MDDGIQHSSSSPSNLRQPSIRSFFQPKELPQRAIRALLPPSSSSKGKDIKEPASARLRQRQPLPPTINLSSSSSSTPHSFIELSDDEDMLDDEQPPPSALNLDSPSNEMSLFSDSGLDMIDPQIRQSLPAPTPTTAKRDTRLDPAVPTKIVSKCDLTTKAIGTDDRKILMGQGVTRRQIDGVIQGERIKARNKSLPHANKPVPLSGDLRNLVVSFCDPITKKISEANKKILVDKGASRVQISRVISCEKQKAQGEEQVGRRDSGHRIDPELRALVVSKIDANHQDHKNRRPKVSQGPSTVDKDKIKEVKIKFNLTTSQVNNRLAVIKRQAARNRSPVPQGQSNQQPETSSTQGIAPAMKRKSSDEQGASSSLSNKRQRQLIPDSEISVLDQLPELASINHENLTEAVQDVFGIKGATSETPAPAVCIDTYLLTANMDLLQCYRCKKPITSSCPKTPSIQRVSKDKGPTFVAELVIHDTVFDGVREDEGDGRIDLSNWDVIDTDSSEEDTDLSEDDGDSSQDDVDLTKNEVDSPPKNIPTPKFTLNLVTV